MIRHTGLTALVLLALAGAARAGSADALFPLVPPESSLTIAIEDLRGQARAFFDSPLAGRLEQWPPFRDWRASDPFKAFLHALRKIEEVTGEKIAVLRDEIYGEAVVLSMTLPGDGEQAAARGLLLLRVRDRDLLGRFIGGIDAAQLNSGELVRVLARTYLGKSYKVREYRNARRLAESYAILDDGTFAWTNSEALLRGVLDRHAGKADGLATDPKFQKLRRRLPAKAALSVFIEPHTFARFLASVATARKPGDERLANLIGRYARALEGVGAALEYRDGFFLQTEELLDPEKLDPWLRRWAARPSGVAPGFGRPLAANALAAGSIQLDFASILELVAELTPESDRNRLELMQLMLKGVLLGHDPRAEIAVRLGPEVRLTVEVPSGEAGVPRFPVVALVEFDKATVGVDVGASLENGLRTALAAYALEAKHGGGRLRWESKAIDGIVVHGLEPASPFLFALSDGRLALGNDAAAVVRGLRPASGGDAGPPFEEWRRAYFPAAGSFLCVDLDAVRRATGQHREALIEILAARHPSSREGVARDLDQVAGLGGVFRGVFATSSIRADGTAIQRRLGLIAPEARP